MHNLKLLFLILCAGCTNSNVAALDLSLLGQQQIDQIEEVAANEFVATCLAAKSNVEVMRAKITEHGWQTASPEDLKAANLTKLPKKILRIPGGGGRYNQTQSIYKKQIGEEIVIMNLEEHFSRNRHDANKCEIYANEALLPNCTSIGKILNRAPDKNQKYDQQNAHFIGWSLTIDDNPSEVVCKRAPNSQILGYDGITLSLSVKHS